MLKLTYFWALLAVMAIQIPDRAYAIEQNAEVVFEKAKSYTVKIRTSVSIPFSGDSKGTFTGAGFVVDISRHWIATNAHVVSRSKALLQVSTFGKEFQPAHFIYIDPYFDIAIIEAPDIGNLKEANLDCGKAPATGTAVGAFGHPWDNSYSGTKGIISGRTSELSNLVGDYLQTDAPINPGNSGGPLIDLQTGNIVGVNTAGHSDAQNMNYAVPIEEVCKIIGLLKKNVDPTPPRIPFLFFKDSDNKNTLRVAKIQDDSLAFGIKIGDVIKAAGPSHEIVKNEPQLLNALRGDLNKAKLFIERDGKEIAFEVPLKSLPPVAKKKGVYFSGMVIRNVMSPELKELFGGGDLVHVEYVEGGGLGESRGVASSDILISINGVEITSVDQAYQILSDLKASGATVDLRLKRPWFEQGHFFTFRDRIVPLENVSWVTLDGVNGPDLDKHILAGTVGK